MIKKSTLLMLVVFSIAAFLAGCGSQTDQPTPVVPTNTLLTETLAVDTEVPEPTQVEQTDPGVVVLITPAEGWEESRSVVERVTQEHGLVLDVRQEMQVESAPPNLSLVVMFGQPAGVELLVEGLPEVKFLGVGEGQWPGTANMYVFGTGSGNSPTQAFMAGYIAAVQSEEYRIGIISVNDAAGQIYREAFLNGVIYFCGTCTPIFPPYEIYPQYVEVPAGADQTTLENAAQTLIASGVNMIHVAPPLQNEQFYFQMLMIGGIRLIGTQPPPEGLEGIWVASVIDSPGNSLENTLSALLSGDPITEGQSSIEITYTGASQARMAHFNEILDMVLSGEIDPVGP